MPKEQAFFMVQDDTCPDIFHKSVLSFADVLPGSLHRHVRVSKNLYSTLYLLHDGKKMLFLYDDKNRRYKRILYHDDATIFAYLSELMEMDTKKSKRKSKFRKLDYVYHTHWWRYFKKQGYCKKEEN